MRIIHFSLVPLVLAPALAQTRLLTIETRRVGPAVIAPDFDGDGVPDLWIGAPSETNNPGQKGRVQVFSGADGAPLSSWSGEAADDGYGSTIAMVGDLDGDGVRDIAIGAPRATQDPSHRPYVQLRSGADATLLRRVAGPAQASGYGSALAALGDVDGDGVPDLAIAAAGDPYLEPGFAEVVSGASGAQLWCTASVDPGGAAISLARVGDRDGDGIGDIAVGFAGLRLVELRSGVDGVVLRTLFGPVDAHGFGASLASGADFDGDGVKDLLVGAPQERIGPVGGGYEGFPHDGSVYLYSGADLTGSPRLRITAQPGEAGFGWSIAALGDFDGDGTPDFVTGNTVSRHGCCIYLPGSARVYSGRDGSKLVYYSSGSGGSYSDAGDWNGDGRADYLASGIRSYGWGLPPATWIVAGQLAWPTLIEGCSSWNGGCEPYLSTAGERSASATEPFVLYGWNFQAGSHGFLVLGSAEGSQPFGSGKLCVAQPFVRLTPAVRDLGPGFPCPTVYSYTFGPGELGQGILGVGETVYAQYVSRNPAGVLGLSSAISFVIYP